MTTIPEYAFRSTEVQQLLTGLKVVLHARVWKSTTQMATQKLKDTSGSANKYEDLVTGTFSSFGALSDDQPRHTRMVSGWCDYHAIDDALVESAVSILVAAREDAAVKVNTPSAASLVMAVVRFCVTQPAFMQLLWNDMGERPRDRLIIQGLTDAITTLVKEADIRRIDSVADDDDDLKAVDEQFPDATDSATTLEWLRNDFAQAQARRKAKRAGSVLSAANVKRQAREESVASRLSMAQREPSVASKLSMAQREPEAKRESSVASRLSMAKRANSVASRLSMAQRESSVASRLSMMKRASEAPKREGSAESKVSLAKPEGSVVSKAADPKEHHTIVVGGGDEGALPRTNEKPSTMQEVLAELHKHSQSGKTTFLTTVPAEDGAQLRDVQAWPMGWEIVEGGEVDKMDLHWMLFRREQQ